MEEEADVFVSTPVRWGRLGSVSAENFLKVTEPIGMRRFAFVTQLTGEAANELGVRAHTAHELDSSNAPAAPVNQIMNIIQNTATGLYAWIDGNPAGRSVRSIQPLKSSFSATTTILGAEK